MDDVRKIWSNIAGQIHIKECELNNLIYKENKTIYDLIKEEYIKGELNSLKAMLDMVNKYFNE